MVTTTYAPVRRARQVDWARARRLAAIRWYRVRWAVKRLAAWVWPLLLDAAGLALATAAAFTVALWLGLAVCALACWALNVRIDKRVREVKGR